MQQKALAFGLFLAFLFTYVCARGRNPCHRSVCPPCQQPQGCQYGLDFDFCKCCARCLKGEGEVCGGPGGSDGRCADNLYCEDKGSSKVCQRNNIICFVPCHLTTCQPTPTCEFGVGKDICGCCDVCLQGPKKVCGEKLKCGEGLYCDYSQPKPICKPRLPYGK